LHIVASNCSKCKKDIPHISQQAAARANQYGSVKHLTN